MEANKVTAEMRRKTGKGPAHRLRAKGFVPAVCYGKEKDSLLLSIDPLELKKSLDPERRVNTVLALDVKGIGAPKEPITVMIQNYQQDPMRGDVLHVDFLRVDKDTMVDIKVPLELTGRAKGVQMGGILQAVFHDLPIRCVPDKIPAKIEYEVSWMDLGDIARVKDIDTGEGVEIKLLPQQTVVSVVAPKALEEEIPAAEAEEAEGEEVAEGAAEGEEAPAPEGGGAG